MEAFIYIAPGHLEKLASADPTVRQGAESAVAIAYREACLLRYGFVPSRFVHFGDLEVTPVDRDDQPWDTPLSPDGQPLDDYDEDFTDHSLIHSS